MSELLSPRETQVAKLIAEDLSDKEIAGRLEISVHTVRVYLERVIAKLGIDRTQLSRRRIIRRWQEQQP